MSPAVRVVVSVLAVGLSGAVLVGYWNTGDRGTLVAMAATVVFALATLWSPSIALAVLTLVAFVTALAMMLLGWAWDLGWYMFPLLVLVWAVAGRRIRTQSFD